MISFAVNNWNIFKFNVCHRYSQGEFGNNDFVSIPATK